MKKTILTLIILTMFTPFAFAGGSQTSGEISADAAVTTGVGWITGVMFTPNGGDATVIIYDNTAASGTVIYRGFVSTGNDYPGGRNWQFPVQFHTGLYVDLTTANVIVEFTKVAP